MASEIMSQAEIDAMLLSYNLTGTTTEIKEEEKGFYPMICIYCRKKIKLKGKDKNENETRTYCSNSRCDKSPFGCMFVGIPYLESKKR